MRIAPWKPCCPGRTIRAILRTVPLCVDVMGLLREGECGAVCASKGRIAERNKAKNKNAGVKADFKLRMALIWMRKTLNPAVPLGSALRLPAYGTAYYT